MQGIQIRMMYRAVRTGTRTAHHRTEPLKAPRIRRYRVISGGNVQNFDHYRPTHLGNARNQLLLLGNSDLMVKLTVEARSHRF